MYKQPNLIIQVKFVMSDETTLADLLALNLHEVEDDVRNIVDKATKELSMEKTLKVWQYYVDMFVLYQKLIYRILLLLYKLGCACIG